MKKILTIIFVGLFVYFPIFFNQFLWDDEVMFNNLGKISPDVYFRPLTSAFYSIIYNIFGFTPFFFHFFQLFFHIVIAVSIYYLLRHFLEETIALILAIIFLVHPANVEAVSFASAMQEIMFVLTGTFGLYLFIKNNSYVKVFYGTCLLLVSLLFKETAIIFFPLVFCYLFLFKNNKKIIYGYLILSGIFLAGYFLFRFLEGNFYVQGQGLFPIMRVSFATRLINIPMIILYYLEKIFYPINLAIAQHWVVKTIDIKSFWLPLIIEIILFFSSIIYFIKTRSKAFLFFFIWFLLGLLPHLQIIPLNMTVAERWTYFPMIGLLGMVGIIIKKRSKLIFPLAVIIIAVFSIRSFTRILNWKNGLTLFSHDIRKDSSFDLQNNLGVELFRAGKYSEAKKYFVNSIELAPYWWVNWNNLGAIYEREKNIQKASQCYHKSINNGQYYLAYENLARILVLYGKNKNNTREFLKTALKTYPGDQKLEEINRYFEESK